MRSFKSSMVYHPMKSGEASDIVHFVLDVFTAYVAPAYSKEGISEFKKFVNVDALEDRVKAGNHILVAESGQRILGVIEISDNRHIALLFVHKFHQRKGIGKELVRKAIEGCRTRNPGIRKITVNSSPNAVAAYEKMGFKGIDDEKVLHGIRFIPMALGLDDIGEQPT